MHNYNLSKPEEGTEYVTVRAACVRSTALYLIFVLVKDCFRKVLHLAEMLGQSPESREGAGLQYISANNKIADG